MTANELAVDLDLQSSQMEYGYAVSDWKLLSDAATMLRQQEAELNEAGHMIGVLREYISDLENGLDSSIKLNKSQALRKAQEK